MSFRPAFKILSGISKTVNFTSNPRCNLFPQIESSKYGTYVRSSHSGKVKLSNKSRKAKDPPENYLYEFEPFKYEGKKLVFKKNFNIEPKKPAMPYYYERNYFVDEIQAQPKRSTKKYREKKTINRKKLMRKSKIARNPFKLPTFVSSKMVNARMFSTNGACPNISIAKFNKPDVKTIENQNKTKENVLFSLFSNIQFVKPYSVEETFPLFRKCEFNSKKYMCNVVIPQYALNEGIQKMEKIQRPKLILHSASINKTMSRYVTTLSEHFKSWFRKNDNSNKRSLCTEEFAPVQLKSLKGVLFEIPNQRQHTTTNCFMIQSRCYHLSQHWQYRKPEHCKEKKKDTDRTCKHTEEEDKDIAALRLRTEGDSSKKVKYVGCNEPARKEEKEEKKKCRITNPLGTSSSVRNYSKSVKDMSIQEIRERLEGKCSKTTGSWKITMPRCDTARKTCDEEPPLPESCCKLEAPYPAYSECKDEDTPKIETECTRCPKPSFPIPTMNKTRSYSTMRHPYEGPVKEQQVSTNLAIKLNRDVWNNSGKSIFAGSSDLNPIGFGNVTKYVNKDRKSTTVIAEKLHIVDESVKNNILHIPSSNDEELNYTARYVFPEIVKSNVGPKQKDDVTCSKIGNYITKDRSIKRR